MHDRIIRRFHLDAGIGDVLMDPLETRRCRDRLGFVGIEPKEVAMIHREQKAAEKVYAYTPNSRVKDLLDLALLIGSVGLDEATPLDALRLKFDRRNPPSYPRC